MDIKFGFITQEKIEDAVVRASMEMSTETVLSWELQSRGGPCPKCKRPFVAVEVDNHFGKFKHYIPGCLCFQVCMTAGGTGCYVNGKWEREAHFWRPGCQKLLIEEELKHSAYCFNCGGQIPMPHKDPGIDWKATGEKQRRTF